MASRNLTALIAVARRVSGDNDATVGNRAFDDAAVTEIINRYYARYKLTSDPWIQDLPAATTGLTVGAGLNTIFATTLTTIRHIDDLFLCATAGTTIRTSEALERCTPDGLDQWANNYTPSLNESIKRYSVQHIGDSTKAAGTVGAWMVRFDPIPTVTTYIVARCVLEATLLSAGTDVPDLSDEEGNGLGLLAGAFMALRIGRDWLVGPALNELPASLTAIAKSIRTDNEPNRVGG
jgi:hypothetical protein